MAHPPTDSLDPFHQESGHGISRDAIVWRLTAIERKAADTERSQGIANDAILCKLRDIELKLAEKDGEKSGGKAVLVLLGGFVGSVCTMAGTWAIFKK